jgi:16S rRNA (adenine1518-N6/adenine1519-N6)-dimethyltransferase
LVELEVTTLLSEKNLRAVIKNLLSDEGIKPRKKLSQSFLVDANELRFIADSVSSIAKESKCIVEIGAGVGNLTAFLASLNTAKEIIAIEVDSRFAKILKKMQEAFPNIDVIISDAREVLPSIRGCEVIVGNLPYHIASPLLVLIAKSMAKVAVVMVQKEVAERLIAKEGSKRYGKLTVFMQHHFNIEYIRTVPSYKFYPKPKVDSAIVLLQRKKEFDKFSELLEHLIRCLFSYRKKILGKAIRKCVNIPQLHALEGLESLWRKRVYQLSVKELEKLVYTIAQQEMKS